MKDWTVFRMLVACVIGMIIGASVVWIKVKKMLENINEYAGKMGKYYHIFNNWLALRQDGKMLYNYLAKNGYHTVAIYGIKEFGQRLLAELEDTDLTVSYIIDKNEVNVNRDIPIYKPGEELPEVDVIVITASYYFSEIVKELRGKVTCDIVSIDDLVYNTLEQ